ncbi:TetR/AcrR family transcriptional regulator [Mycobacterium talmoniae]|uniref:TetR family transcriptional regulator n=1 Tax=Mycobacterium talmoniae TaxID=1858794 RepID=A0A1S1NH29_9MYCO|nr:MULTISPECIES: TetR/AcrR family transcriptional regulator [Mycobacterium]OHV03094.1 TetR family transcriptional regulator [Mycobacterium talmoniae]TDH56897.1 TetR/AcrR family transcriptional regulator [Mycobacterium eburneum]
MSSPTRWAGVSLTDRRAERRGLLIDAAFRLFGAGGEAAVSVRSVCRECALHTRYFYESFTDTDELLGAVYDRVAAELIAQVEAAVTAAGDDDRARMRAGVRAVLGFSSADPRRGRVLFTEARANPVLVGRRAIAQEGLRELVLTEVDPHADPVAAQVGAAMYTGAMAELAQQWLAGNLGDDLDAVTEHAVRLVAPPR